MKKKKSLAMQSFTRQAKVVKSAVKTPIIGVSIILSDFEARVSTCPEAIAIMTEAVGEDKAVAWHVKYMNKFQKLTDECCKELAELFADEIKRRAKEQKDK